MTRTLARVATAALLSTGGLVLSSAPALAHPHSAQNGQTIANGQLHPKFVADGTSCESYGTPGTGTAPVGPAWYGLETAHHGPDRGAPGKGDGCYQTEVSWNGAAWVPAEDTNPGIN